MDKPEEHPKKIDLETYSDLVSQCIEAGDDQEFENEPLGSESSNMVGRVFSSNSQFKVLAYAVGGLLVLQILALACLLIIHVKMPTRMTQDEAQHQLSTRLGPDLRLIGIARALLEAIPKNNDLSSAAFTKAVEEYNQSLSTAYNLDSNAYAPEKFELKSFVSSSTGVEYVTSSPSNP